jgi:hypothetical protein
VLYADFECIIKKIENHDSDASTVKQQQHIADGFCVYVKSTDSRFFKEPYVYVGENSAEKFIDYILETSREIRGIYKNKIPMKPLTADELQHHNLKTKCYLCEVDFVSDPRAENYIQNSKVRDHCHITGSYRGAAHSICNLQLRIDHEKVKIPCILHNLKGYDSHLILSAVKKRHGEVSGELNLSLP